MSLAGDPIEGSGHERAMERSDAELWTRSRAGDRDAFGGLFDRVFIEAWRRRDKELPPDKVLPWL
jgi:hypothetical protein